MGGKPDLLFIIDTNREELAVKEAQKLGIPIVAIIDTNCQAEGIDFRPPNLVTLNTDHSQGRVLEIDLAEDAPDAASLVGRAIPVQSYFDLDSLSGGEGRRA